MLNCNDATLCECCEANPINNPKSADETCNDVLDSCKLKYCRFDNIVKSKNCSVDCLRVSSDDKLIMLEIKCQNSGNIKIDNLQHKIEETVDYLVKNESELAQKKKMFLLCISEKKQKIVVSKSKSRYFFQLGKYLLNKNLSIFNGQPYRFSVSSVPYSVWAKIIYCKDADSVCK